jgi:hypothetical protein
MRTTTHRSRRLVSAAAATVLALPIAGAAPAGAAQPTSPVAAAEQRTAAPTRDEVNFRCAVSGGWQECSAVRVEPGETVTVSLNDLSTVPQADFIGVDRNGTILSAGARLGDVLGVSPQSPPTAIWTNNENTTVEVGLTARGYGGGTIVGTLLAR